MATTLTSDAYLDGLTVSAGEAFTLNGATLTVRTDTRVHSTAPASMNGSLGSVTISPTLGGGYSIDGTRVRWMAYDTGTGTVPAIGTSITQGGVSGYLLGVWPDYTSAPTAVGAAMPASGYLKFREVTGGTYSAGALTGIGANATSADVTGWIEVVHRDSSQITVPRLSSNGFMVRGDWFYLGTTSGSRHQSFQVPTNGGGSNTNITGIEVETASGSGVYEPWIMLTVANGFTTAVIGTDARAKIARASGSGVFKIGGDGTNSIGYLPPSGCNVRIANVIGRSCVSGSDSTNGAPNNTLTSRPKIVTSSSGIVDIEYLYSNWYFSLGSAYSVKLKNVATEGAATISNAATTVTVDRLIVSQISTFTPTPGNYPLYLSSCTGTLTLSNLAIYRKDQATNARTINITSCANITMDSVRSYHPDSLSTRNSSSYTIYVSASFNITLTNLTLIGNSLQIISSNLVSASNVDYCDRIVSTTSASVTPVYAIRVLSSTNIVVDTVTLGLNGTIANQHPYLGMFNITNNLDNIRLRNFGTIASPIDCGSSDAMGYVVFDGAGNSNVKAKRMYTFGQRTGVISSDQSSTGFIAENVWGDTSTGTNLSTYTSLYKGIRQQPITGGTNGVYGVHFVDYLLTDTTGLLALYMNEPSSTTIAVATVTSGSPRFTGTGQISMPIIGDQVVWQMSYYAKAHTGFQNTSPSLSGVNTSTNFTYEYDLDINDGNGFSGTWKTLDGTNLSAETISPSDGFKMKYRVTCTASDPTNVVTSIRIDTDSTLAAQTANQYELDVGTFTIEGHVANTRVQVYNLDTNTEILNKYISTTDSASYEIGGAIAADGSNLRVRFCAKGYLPEELFVTWDLFQGTTVVPHPVVDDIYVSNGIDGATVTEFSLDGSSLIFDLDDPDGITTVQRGYAWFSYITTTAAGITRAYGAMTATDEVNYVINQDVLDFYFKNINASLPVNLIGGYIHKKDDSSLIDPDSYSFFINPGKAFIARIDATTLSEIKDNTDKSLTLNQFIGLK